MSTKRNTKYSCYLSCIQRACKEFRGLHIAAIQALHIPQCHITIYAVYMEDTDTGRSWVVLRRYSEFYELRREMRNIFTNLREDAQTLQDSEAERVIQKKLSVFKFPSKFSTLTLPTAFRTKDRQPQVANAASRAKTLCHWLQGVIDTIHEVEHIHSKNAKTLTWKKYRQSIRIDDTSMMIQSLLVPFVGGPGGRYSWSFFCPSPIPQQNLPLEKRVSVSKCGSLETVFEATGSENDDYRTE